MTHVQIQGVFQKQKNNGLFLAQSDAKVRIAKLKRLQGYLLDHIAEACSATREDFSKPEAETIIGELLVLQSEISYTVKHLTRWLSPQKQSSTLSAIGTSAYIQYEPKGCSLIIAPWNYPINLAFKPLISAIAAGCTAIIKPSELTPNSSAFVKSVVEHLFQPDEVAVIEGDADVATQLLSLPFNHIFFTGSPLVGKIVMKAAAEHLASVTLELGGKSPSIVDETADIPMTARLIAWGKFFNNGQTCIAPDYVLVHHSVHDRFVNEIKNVVNEMYNKEGKGIEESLSYARIVNEKHFHRLLSLLSDATESGALIKVGGESRLSSRFIAPTVLTNVKDSMRIMNEEIFGPILPIKSYGTLQEAVDHVNKGEKPLALYIHSKNKNNSEFILKNTSAGNALVNEVLTQFGNPDIPFGGVNNSGIGKSNGFYGFQEFSNAKGVMRRRFGTVRFLFPPYSERFVGWLKKGLKWV